MRPVIKRITDKIRHNLRPFHKLVVTRLSAGYIFLGYTVGTHRTPFIVVASEPELRNVLRRVVFINLFRGKVTVPVENRSSFRTLFIYFLCCFCGKQEILVHKFFHFSFPFAL